MFNKLLRIGMLPMLVVLLSPFAAAEELCAEVRIEILQELTMERQGFEALMRINNSLDSFELRDVSVSVNFEDADGNAVTATSDTSASDAAFFIRLDASQNVSGLEAGANGQVGYGVIAPNSTGELRWLIIPTANAAGQLQDGKLYYVGARLSYSYGGKEEVVEVAPDSIVVIPQPALTLDYFLTQEIIGDDAFTPQIEPPEPYTLGVRLSNSGYGIARSVNIESAQPTIVENELGLAVDFKILGSYLAGGPSSPSLLINFGDIEPEGVKNGRWIMETNLSGRFTAFTASFTHADELGGQLTSLLQATNAHFLKRDVVVDLPGRDTVRDFLAYGPTGGLYVYESENTGLNETVCSNCAVVIELSANLNHQGGTSTLSHDSEAGFSFAQVSDPYRGSKVLERVVRSDGKVMNPQNAWLSKKRANDKVSFNYFINIFDVVSTGQYTLYWGGDISDVPQPPVIRFIPSQITYEGGSLGFLVLSSDPNGTTPTISARTLPAGAEFTDQGNGNGVFQWSPQYGQAGAYSLMFVASDGALTTERTVSVQVNPWYDTDGDGMDDAWEMEHFGTLDRDGTDDFSGNGRTDLQEFLEGTDPTVANIIPGRPRVKYPLFDADTLDGAVEPFYPLLIVTNSDHATGIDNVEVIFEIYGDEGLSMPVAAGAVAEGGETTSFQIAEQHMLEGAVFSDNTLYYWRARARNIDNAEQTSGWMKSRFFISTYASPPSIPRISSPELESVVDDLSPTLAVTNSSTPDRSRLFYAFALYEENDLATPVAKVSGLAPGSNGETAWKVPVLLAESTGYFWQATVTSENGESTASEWGFFLVSMGNLAPSEPHIHNPKNGAVIEELSPEGSFRLSVINGEDPERMPLSYYFELDVTETFDTDKKQTSDAVEETNGITTWIVQNLKDDQRYYWRVRAFDGELYSGWVRGEFSVSIAEETPPVPVLQNPVEDSVVARLRPLFEVNPVAADGDRTVLYRFELYAELGHAGFVTEMIGADTQWSLDFDLENGVTYYWRVRAEYEDELVGGWSETRAFSISVPKENRPPKLDFVLPDQNIEVGADREVLIRWVDSAPDHPAEIALYYQYESDAPVLMVSGISADLDGEGDQYVWDTGGLPPGEYRVSAIIADAENEVSVEHCCTITITEQLVKTLSIVPQQPFVTNEGGTVDAVLDIVLNDPLTGNDTIILNFSVSDQSEGQVIGESYLAFDSANWNQPQAIRLRGVDDCVVDGDQSFDLVFEPIVSSDADYDGVVIEPLTVTNQDNERLGQVHFVCEYSLVGEEYVGDGLVDYTYRAKLRNQGDALEGATAELNLLPAANGSTEQSLPSGGLLSFPSVADNDSVWSTDTFVLRHAPNQSADFAKLRWTVMADMEPEACDLSDPDAAQYPPWDNGIAYQGGQRVSYEGLVWEAKWWSQNNSPMAPQSVWTLISDVELSWTAGLVYEFGAEVNHNGRRWYAKWWTQTEEPGTGGAWEDLGPASCSGAGPDLGRLEPVKCDLMDPGAANHSYWSSDDAYPAGARVNYQELIWEALRWNSGQSPESEKAPWKLISDVEYPWSASLVYNMGDEANHNGQRWRAMWWVQGGKPGISPAWLLIGSSSCP